MRKNVVAKPVVTRCANCDQALIPDVHGLYGFAHASNRDVRCYQNDRDHIARPAR
jgi:hypothetical protein